MKALFKELSVFESLREDYLDDEAFREFQQMLLENPTAGDVIKGTGGLRKVRFRDQGRGKGKRGGVRIIYYWFREGMQFWLFTIYDKDAVDDLTHKQRKMLKALLEREVEANGQA